MGRGRGKKGGDSPGSYFVKITLPVVWSMELTREVSPEGDKFGDCYRLNVCVPHPPIPMLRP